MDHWCGPPVSTLKPMIEIETEHWSMSISFCIIEPVNKEIRKPCQYQDVELLKKLSYYICSKKNPNTHG